MTGTSPHLPASIAGLLQRAFDSSTSGLSGYVSSTSTPIHDQLLFSRTDWANNEWINPFRPMTWKGHSLYVRSAYGRFSDDIPLKLKEPRPEDTNPPWSRRSV